jgi:hypothetical protein
MALEKIRKKNCMDLEINYFNSRKVHSNNFFGSKMIELYNLPFVISYVDNICNDYINLYLNKNKELNKISNKQKIWLIFCISMTILTNSINWDRFERFSLKSYKSRALSFMFHHAGIPLQVLFDAAIKYLIDLYKIIKIHLIIDDTDRPRSKVIKVISFVFKNFDKKTGGYFNCQNLVFLVLVCNKITIPVGFKFYTPCPKIKEWEKLDKEIRRLNKEGFLENGKKLPRPPKPERSIDCPTRNQIAVQLIKEFKEKFPFLKIISCSFDAAYSTFETLTNVEKILETALVVSEFACSILVSDSRRTAKINDYFKSISTQKVTITIRGGKEQIVEIKHARVFVPSHGRKYNVVALRYDGEIDFRFIVTSNLCWRAKDVVQIYCYRWLVEVFFFDWKCYEGWGQAAMQQKNAGALCGVLMSLLSDLCLLSHPEQIRRINSGLPACTVGSLREKIIIEQHLHHIKGLLYSSNPVEKIKAYADNIEKCFVYRDSKKHMSARNFPDFGPDPNLVKKYSNAVA